MLKAIKTAWESVCGEMTTTLGIVHQFLNLLHIYHAEPPLIWQLYNFTKEPRLVILECHLVFRGSTVIVSQVVRAGKDPTLSLT